MGQRRRMRRRRKRSRWHHIIIREYIYVDIWRVFSTIACKEPIISSDRGRYLKPKYCARGINFRDGSLALYIHSSLVLVLVLVLACLPSCCQILSTPFYGVQIAQIHFHIISACRHHAYGQTNTHHTGYVLTLYTYTTNKPICAVQDPLYLFQSFPRSALISSLVITIQKLYMIMPKLGNSPWIRWQSPQ